jgi:hypothetical protein
MRGRAALTGHDANDPLRTHAKTNYRTAAKLVTSSFRTGMLQRKSLAGPADAIRSINAARVDRAARRRLSQYLIPPQWAVLK